MSNFNAKQAGTGTKEWAEINYNIGKGCSHGCRYCYAFGMAFDSKRIKSMEEWRKQVIVEKKVTKKLGKTYENKLVMFPSSHDITPEYLDASITTIQKLLDAGVNLLIVSKPHLDCIKRICEEFKNYKEKILFRFTIGSLDEEVCKFWEPGAPAPDERLEALKLAADKGFFTSVSCEPMLEGIDGIYRVVEAVSPYVTHTIWIGKMNMQRNKTDRTLPEVIQLGQLQADEEILKMVKKYSQNRKIEWKDSIKKVINTANNKALKTKTLFSSP